MKCDRACPHLRRVAREEEAVGVLADAQREAQLGLSEVLQARGRRRKGGTLAILTHLEQSHSLPVVYLASMRQVHTATGEASVPPTQVSATAGGVGAYLHFVHVDGVDGHTGAQAAPFDHVAARNGLQRAVDVAGGRRKEDRERAQNVTTVSLENSRYTGR